MMDAAVQKTRRLLEENKGYYLLSSLFAVSLILVILSPKNLFGWGIFGFFLIRTVCLQKKSVRLVSAGILLLTAVFTVGQVRSSCSILFPEAEGTEIVFNPAHYQLEENLLSGIGEVLQEGKKEKAAFFFRLSSDEEIAFWSGQKEAFQAKAAVKWKKPEPNRNLHQFSYQEYLYHQKIHWTLQIETMEYFKKAESPVYFLSNVRLYFLSWLQNHLPEGKTSAYLLAMLFNDKHLLEKEIMDGYQKIGIVHLFSISGMHVHFLLSYFNYILLRLKLTRETVQPLLLFFLLLYACLTGGGAGIFRAVFTNGLLLAAAIFKWELEAKDAFAFSLLAALWLNPYSLFQLGFQLSYSLAGVLYMLAPQLQEKKGFGLAQEAALSAVMAFVSFPFLSYHFYEVAWIGVFANLFFSFLFSRYFMPLFWMSVFAAGIPLFSKPLLLLHFLGGEILKAAEWIAGQIASAGWLMMITGRQPIFFYLLWLLLLLFLLTAWEKGADWRKPAVFLLFYLLFFYHLPAWNPAGKAAVLDVGQGDAILITTPYRKQTILIDTGGKTDWNIKKDQKQEPNEKQDEKLLQTLKAEGIRKLDAVILTHADFDHIGSLAYLIKEMPVRQLYFASGAERNPVLLDTLTLAAEKKINIQPLLAPQSLAFDGIQLEMLWPFEKGKGKNDDSIVLLAKIGGLVWLFMGDLEAEGEKALLRNYPNLKADVLKVGHHGSGTSTGEAFLEQLAPSVALISAGQSNSYGHPHPDVVQRLAQRNVTVYRTDQQGAIHYLYQGRRKEWWHVIQ